MNNDFIIRSERTDDFRAVEHLVRESFWNVYQTPAGYYVDDADVEMFDRDFPPKQKLKLPGQIFS